MSTYVQEGGYEQVTDIIVVDSGSAEPEQILELHEETPLQATSATTPPPRQSRLSMAFNRLSCGFCFHPYKNSYSTDYHALVHTPTEEDGPILGDEDYSPEGDQEYFTYAAASQENLRDEEQVLVDSGASEQGGPSTSDDDKATREPGVTLPIGDDEADEDEDADEGDQSEAHPTDSVTDLVQDVSPARSLLDQPLVTPVTTAELESSEQTPAAEKTGKKGAKSPVNRVFSKLKLRRSSSSTSSSPSPSTPSSPPASPMLLGRFTNRLKKRTKEASTSSTSKAEVEEALKMSSEPSAEATVASVTAAAAAATEQDLQLDIHETVVMDDGDESDDQEPLILTEEPMEMRLPAAQPVAIPSTSGAEEAWTESPTLHQTDASAGTAMSGQTLIKLGRSSTVGSTVGGESETGSVKSNGSGKEAKDAQPQQEEPKRKGSMLKKIEKFGKIIKNEKRKSTGGDSYFGRRLSRRGSATLQSSTEVEKTH